MIGQSLDAHLKAEGHDVHATKGQKETTLKPARENERDHDESPFQAKGEADVAQNVTDGRRPDDIAPMQ